MLSLYSFLGLYLLQTSRLSFTSRLAGAACYNFIFLTILQVSNYVSGVFEEKTFQ